jgi:3',5'-cyclic AMP phosphodiesterase CpdA
MPFTLAHLSDVHIAPLPAPRIGELMGKRVTGYVNWWRKRRLVHDRLTLDGLVSDLKAQATDHIAVTGDVANIALAAEFERGRAWIETLGATRDISFVPGNHDIYVPEAVAMCATAFGDFMRGDDGRDVFPYLRRRGPLALIGLNTGVPTPPLMATGRVGAEQLAALGPLLDRTRADGLYRVILIHHPPVSRSSPHKRLLDAAGLMRVIAAHGAELLLHGHDHLNMLNWLTGPDGTRVPAIGVPSASAAPGLSHDAAAYNLYRVEGAPGAWTCTMVSRGLGPGGRIEERLAMTLAP